ncbi:hypothetical protein B0J13DRAFT_641199 [Dactylonectria estremocensis]|uniref:Uncharacterized protein n=1 Tax=Dactylonectria estremocensis TaxID=1079267 RepID=A0A9P9EDM7_9HYPO|nr:hypothetical protein B0J13DRAFT_641199 [Dactylonectria estremocensis]
MDRPLEEADLPEVNRLLEALVNQPQLLDRARTRFIESPPQLPSPLAPTDPFADPRTDEERLRDQRIPELTMKQHVSEPESQFRDQVREEGEFDVRVRRAKILAEKHGSKVFLGDLEDLIDNVYVDDETNQRMVETIQKQWMERGIWKAEWRSTFGNRLGPFGHWHHGGSLELESESEIDTASTPVSRLGTTKRQANTSRPKSDEETQRVAERRALLEREHEASRPYHHFMYLLPKARDRIQQLLKLGEAPDLDPADINTKAYEHVKNRWIEKGVWIDKWGVMPGMRWMHEYDIEDLLADQTWWQGLREAEKAPPSRSSSAAFSIGTPETFHSVCRWEQSAHPAPEQNDKDSHCSSGPLGPGALEAPHDTKSPGSGLLGGTGAWEALSEGETESLGLSPLGVPTWSTHHASDVCLASRETKSLGRGYTEGPSPIPHVPPRRSERLSVAKRARYN